MEFDKINDLRIYAKEDSEVKITAKEAAEALEILHSAPAGKSIIAAQTKGQVKRELAYEGRMRKVFDTYTLTQAEEAVFDADIDVPAVALSKNGLPEIVNVDTDRLRIDTSVNAASMNVRWNVSNFLKYDILEWARLRAMASLQVKEDSKGYTLLKYATDNLTSGQASVQSLSGTTAADNNASTVNELSDRLSAISIATAIGKLRGKLLPAGCMMVNPERLTDLLLFNVAVIGGNLNAGGGFGIFAPVVQEDLWKTGFMGEVFGTPVYDSVVIPNAEAYVLAPKEYLGKLAVRTDVSIKTLSDPKSFGDIFTLWEDIGFAIRYAKGIVRIDI